MKNTYHKSVILSLALILALSPALSFAKEKENREEHENKIQVGLKAENKESKEVRSSRKSCVKAFGHLIASGYKNKNGEANLDFWKDCVIPFGIAKKLGLGTTTVPVKTDTVAPVISNLNVTVGTSTATLSWNTNENANSKVYWSTISPLSVSATTTASSTSNLMTKAHRMSITGLSATTTYYFKVESSDSSGNTSSSTTLTATTH